jgi:hypothetical protein
MLIAVKVNGHFIHSTKSGGVLVVRWGAAYEDLLFDGLHYTTVSAGRWCEKGSG